MPIRVTCQCGHSLAVPDNLAGKSGKCPKCQQILKIPASNEAASSPVAKQNPAAKPKPPAPAQPSSSLDGLFESAGLSQKKGKLCPSCDAPIQPGSVICIKCGFHFEEGAQLTGFKSTQKKAFGNKRLNEAATMMEREAETESRLLNTGPPWWFLFSALAGLLIFIGGAAIKMDAATTGNKSSVEMLSRIQSASMFTVLCASGGAACILVANFATLAILFTAFFESLKQGLLCFFAPFYIIYYMFSRIKSKALFSTVLIFWGTIIVGGLLLAYSLPKI
jgi:hypothetical protein